MSELQQAINEDLENALVNSGRVFLGLTNKDVMDDLRGCTGGYLNTPNLTMLMIINQWRRKERRSYQKQSKT